MVTLVVEDGTGIINANAFISLAYANTYFTDIANEVWFDAAYDDDDKNSALIRGTSYMSNHYEWDGLRTYGRDGQALYFPRSGICDKEGYGIPVDEMPVELLQATAEVSVLELETPNIMSPNFIAGDLVKFEKVDVLEVEYTNQNTGISGQRPDVSKIYDLISSFLKQGGGRLSSINGTTIRI